MSVSQSSPFFKRITAASMESQSTPLRIILADDHPIITSNIGAVVAEHGIVVVGVAYNAEEVVALYREIKADVVVLDYSFHGTMDGADILRELLILDPKAKILIYTHHDHADIYRLCYSLGALGFLTKRAEIPELVRAIQIVGDGGLYVNSEIERRIARDVLRPKNSESTLTQQDLSALRIIRRWVTKVKAPNEQMQPQDIMRTIANEVGTTPQAIRELYVFLRICDGVSPEDIAKELGIATRTFSADLFNIRQRLQTPKLPDMIKLAFRHRLLEL